MWNKNLPVGLHSDKPVADAYLNTMHTSLLHLPPRLSVLFPLSVIDGQLALCLPLPLTADFKYDLDWVKAFPESWWAHSEWSGKVTVEENGLWFSRGAKYSVLTKGWHHPIHWWPKQSMRVGRANSLSSAVRTPVVPPGAGSLFWPWLWGKKSQHLRAPAPQLPSVLPNLHLRYSTDSPGSPAYRGVRLLSPRIPWAKNSPVTCAPLSIYSPSV